VIDTHCHLTFPDFHEPKMPGGIPRVLADAASHGVTGCISISTTSADCVNALEIAHKYPNVWCSAGVHPLYSDEGPHDWATIARVAASPRCVAWGELGLDNHYKEPVRDTQHQVLHEQLAFIEAQHANGVGQPGRTLPIVIHCREAFADLLPILRATRLDPSRFVFHCFTGTPTDMRSILDFGAFVSFTGVATYRNAADVREAIRLVPNDRIMIETDAPFLSPEPHRGTRPCQPWMASVTAANIAELRGTPLQAFLSIIDENTKRFYAVPPR
jgi:TatD DNase family protein